MSSSSPNYTIRIEEVINAEKGAIPRVSESKILPEAPLREYLRVVSSVFRSRSGQDPSSFDGSKSMIIYQWVRLWSCRFNQSESSYSQYRPFTTSLPNMRGVRPMVCLECN